MKAWNASAAALLALSLVIAAVAPAEARARRQPASGDDEMSWQGGDQRVCTKICPQDASPCDPIYFKIADGRCAAIYSK
jgi:hypothetical protein